MRAAEQKEVLRVLPDNSTEELTLRYNNEYDPFHSSN